MNLFLKSTKIAKRKSSHFILHIKTNLHVLYNVQSIFEDRMREWEWTIDGGNNNKKNGDDDDDDNNDNEGWERIQ